MDTQAFQHLLAHQLNQFSSKQRSTVMRVLHESAATDVLQGSLPDLPACPHCQAPAAQLAPWGWSRGLRRYRCRACGRTCNTLTGSALAHPRKADCWQAYSQALIDGLTLRQAARVAASTRTRPSCGGTAFFAPLPGIAIRARAALSKPMRPFSWSPSKGSAACRSLLAGAAVSGPRVKRARTKSR